MHDDARRTSNATESNRDSPLTALEPPPTVEAATGLREGRRVREDRSCERSRRRSSRPRLPDSGSAPASSSTSMISRKIGCASPSSISPLRNDRVHQRRHARHVLRVRVGPGRQQVSDRLDLTSEGSRHQRGRPVFVGALRAHSLGQQMLQPLAIPDRSRIAKPGSTRKAAPVREANDVGHYLFLRREADLLVPHSMTRRVPRPRLRSLPCLPWRRSRRLPSASSSRSRSSPERRGSR